MEAALDAVPWVAGYVRLGGLCWGVGVDGYVDGFGHRRAGAAIHFIHTHMQQPRACARTIKGDGRMDPPNALPVCTPRCRRRCLLAVDRARSLDASNPRRLWRLLLSTRHVAAADDADADRRGGVGVMQQVPWLLLLLLAAPPSDLTTTPFLRVC